MKLCNTRQAFHRSMQCWMTVWQRLVSTSIQCLEGFVTGINIVASTKVNDRVTHPVLVIPAITVPVDGWWMAGWWASTWPRLASVSNHTTTTALPFPARQVTPCCWEWGHVWTSPVKTKSLKSMKVGLATMWYKMMIIQEWNHLPSHIINSPTLETFRSRITNHYLLNPNPNPVLIRISTLILTIILILPKPLEYPAQPPHIMLPKSGALLDLLQKSEN